jgi:hypothetical protein
MPDIQAFKKDLEGLINHHSLENLSNTPDFILADYLTECLLNYNTVVTHRDKWFGVDMWHGASVLNTEPPENIQTPTTGDS